MELEVLGLNATQCIKAYLHVRFQRLILQLASAFVCYSHFSINKKALANAKSDSRVNEPLDLFRCPIYESDFALD
jgi:hypothetical protein